MKTSIIRPFAHYIASQLKRDAKNAVNDQEKIRKHLIRRGINTHYGKDHNFSSILSYNNFKQHIPISDYEGSKNYFDLIKSGKSNILWPGKPKYFAKTSGTTSGTKYIPVSQESVHNHIHSARNALFNYISQKRNSRIFDGKVMFLSGSPTLSETGGIKTGRLSGIVNHEVPAWLRANQLPSHDTNCTEDWEEKVDQIVEETYDQDMRLISGIPPWVLMYFEKLLEKTGKETIKEIFPNFSLFAHGGVNFEPYRPSIRAVIGEDIDMIETYPASEGFIAFSVDLNHDGLLLNTNSGIFYEFVPMETIHNSHPERFSLQDVEIGVDYALIINNNAGLWGYNIGDTIRFISKNPYYIIVSGRIKHFISAFGEHVIGKEVEQALADTINAYDSKVIDFTVAPQVNPVSGLPYHEWFVEFESEPVDLNSFSADLDKALRLQNIYYDDLVTGSILRPLVLTKIQKEGFRNMMKAKGKLGGQNKIPRLSNNRNLVEELRLFIIE